MGGASESRPPSWLGGGASPLDWGPCQVWGRGGGVALTDNPFLSLPIRG